MIKTVFYTVQQWVVALLLVYKLIYHGVMDYLSGSEGSGEAGVFP